ncbi:SMI1/KNR4 family protein [Streptacidiphilus carbonis]|uniref:SMI1/KNR4 family protein n=1 Tax=Streptacidiphilus carbonis TaxID=105422 RepID=UPI0005A7917D|nr:SMI1/KNR4 family protein [Streptacidiphilus carbonis]
MHWGFVDFEIGPPYEHDVRVTAADAEFADGCHLVGPGGRVELVFGFSVTAEPDDDLTVTLRGSAEPAARNVPVRIAVNGQPLDSVQTARGEGEPAQWRIAIPRELLTRRPDDVLSLHVDPDADGGLRLLQVLVDPSARIGQADQIRRKVAADGTLWAYLTHTGAPGAEKSDSAQGVLWLALGGLGRAALASLGWRLRDGERANLVFEVDQRRFTGYRVSAKDGAPAWCRGEVAGVRRLPRALPRQHLTVVFDAQLLGEQGWSDIAPLSVLVDVDESRSPLAEIEWGTDQHRARTTIAVTPDGQAFFGHHQRPGQRPVGFRGRLRGSGRPFPFQPATTAPPLPAEPAVERFDNCPAKELTGGSLAAPDVIAAARRALADATTTGRPEQTRRVGAALRHHLLAHGFTHRPEVARAIAALVPDQAPVAVGRLARFLDDAQHDPSAQGGMYLERKPGDYEHLCTAVALAALDPAYAATAAQAYREADPYPAALFGADFGLLGPDQCEQAQLHLQHLAAGPHSKEVAATAVRSLIRLGELETALHALRGLTERGVFLSQIVRPLAQADPALQPALVDSELRALAADPGNLLHLAVRGQAQPVRDVPAEVIACGDQYRDRLARALWELVRSAALSPDIRWRAAYRLTLVSPAEHEQAVRALTTEGVYDPEAPPPQPAPRTDRELAAALEEVAAVWQRIERELEQRFPDFPAVFDAPASAEEVAACEQALGLQLPVEFVASCLVHRSISFGDLVDGMPNQMDLGDLADYRQYMGGEWSSDTPDPADAQVRGDYGWRDGWIPLDPGLGPDSAALDLDPAPSGHYGQVIAMDNGTPQGVHAAGWLELLQRFASHLEQDHYTLHKEGYLDLPRG